MHILLSNKPVFVAITQADMVNDYIHNYMYQHLLILVP